MVTVSDASSNGMSVLCQSQTQYITDINVEMIVLNGRFSSI